MKIGILQADSVLPHLQNEHGNYPEMFQKLLEEAARSITEIDRLEIKHYDIEHGQYPAKIDDCDAYLITGSKKSVYDDEPWIHDLKEYVLALNKVRKKLIGICFGHQMVALALGGKTEPAEVGWGVGIHSSNVVVQKSYMNPPLSKLSAIVSHKDQVTQLPEGAELVSTSDFCPNAMYLSLIHI